jgi:hypothetical protein
VEWAKGTVTIVSMRHRLSPTCAGRATPPAVHGGLTSTRVSTTRLVALRQQKCPRAIHNGCCVLARRKRPVARRMCDCVPQLRTGARLGFRVQRRQNFALRCIRFPVRTEASAKRTTNACVSRAVGLNGSASPNTWKLGTRSTTSLGGKRCGNCAAHPNCVPQNRSTKRGPPATGPAFFPSSEHVGACRNAPTRL